MCCGAVDLEVFEHKLLVMVGPSSSGKTGMLNIMGGSNRPRSAMWFRDTHIALATRRKLTRIPPRLGWIIFVL